jgi:hypothetical protein
MKWGEERTRRVFASWLEAHATDSMIFVILVSFSIDFRFFVAWWHLPLFIRPTIFFISQVIYKN